MDYMVRFKFLAKTDNPTRIFDSSKVNSSTFKSNFEFPPGEPGHREAWWDISSRPLVGGFVPVDHGRTLVVAYAENEDDTLTVYAWRHEGLFEHAAGSENGAAPREDVNPNF